MQLVVKAVAIVGLAHLPQPLLTPVMVEMALAIQIQDKMVALV
jgi:hypothetical protein